MNVTLEHQDQHRLDEETWVLEVRSIMELEGSLTVVVDQFTAVTSDGVGSTVSLDEDGGFEAPDATACGNLESDRAVELAAELQDFVAALPEDRASEPLESQIQVRSSEEAAALFEQYEAIYENYSSSLLSGTGTYGGCLLYTSPSPRDQRGSRMPSSA